jgi:hypothetical protein
MSKSIENRQPMALNGIGERPKASGVIMAASAGQRKYQCNKWRIMIRRNSGVKINLLRASLRQPVAAPRATLSAAMLRWVCAYHNARRRLAAAPHISGAQHRVREQTNHSATRRICCAARMLPRISTPRLSRTAHVGAATRKRDNSAAPRQAMKNGVMAIISNGGSVAWRQRKSSGRRIWRNVAASIAAAWHRKISSAMKNKNGKRQRNENGGDERQWRNQRRQASAASLKWRGIIRREKRMAPAA